MWDTNRLVMLFAINLDISHEYPWLMHTLCLKILQCFSRNVFLCLWSVLTLEGNIKIRVSNVKIASGVVLILQRPAKKAEGIHRYDSCHQQIHKHGIQ